MIAYNPKDWFTFIFRIHKTDTLRQLFPMLIAMVIYSGLVAYLCLNLVPEKVQATLKDLTLLHTLLAFVLSLLLVFRTNSAYDRWWEGRKAWGSLVNNSRNLAIKLSAIFPLNDTRNRAFFAKIIPLYAYALKNHLQKVQVALAIDEELSKEFRTIHPDKQIPNQIAENIYAKLTELHQIQQIENVQFRNIDENFNEFTNVCGICERIKSSPIPYSYNVFIKKFIFFYVMSLPWCFSFSMGYSVIFVATFIFYVLASIEIIAEEIEDPFGNDTNDIPMETICKNIKKNVRDILLR